MNDKIEKIRAAMADQGFVKACIEANSDEEVQKLFAGKEIDMSMNEIELLKEMVSAVADGSLTEEQLEKLSNGGELTEEDLEGAAGGNGFFYTPAFVKTSNGNYISGEVLNKGRVGMAVGGAAVVVIAACGIAEACGVDLVGGVKSGCSWVKENITRW